MYGVMDVGSNAIKALLFETPAAGALPRPIKKFVWEAPESWSPLRLVQKTKESVDIITKAYPGMVKQVLIGVGPSIGEAELETLTASVGGGAGMLTRKDIRLAYERLLAGYMDPRRATIASPIEFTVNGYPLVWQKNWQREEILPRSQVQEVCFRMIGFRMALESGAEFIAMKNTLAALAIEFLPLAVSQKEAVARGLSLPDALIIDIGVSATALVSVREGRFAHAAFMPFGTGRMARMLRGRSPSEAHALMRQYAAGMADGQLRREVAEAVGRAADEWKKMFVATLASFYAGGPLSANVLLCGGGARLEEIRVVLGARDWLGDFSYTDAARVRALEGAAFFGGDTLGGNLRGPEDTGLGALMMYSLHHQPIF